MSILTHDERTLFATLGIGEHPAPVRVHVTYDVGIFFLPSLLKLYEASFIVRFQPAILLMEYLSIATLITHRPTNDARMVTVTIEHTMDAVTVCRSPFLAISWMWYGIGEIDTTAHSVGLDICLIHHIDAILITEVEPFWTIRIMAATHGIDVQLTQAAQIIHHNFVALHVS